MRSVFQFNFIIVCGHERPLRTFFERLRDEMNPELENNIANLFKPVGSLSAAHNSAVTNEINLAGIPIKNTVSGAHTASTSTGLAGNLVEQFSIGNLGITAGLNSEQIGTGFGINRKPGELGLHLGGLNFGFTNHAAEKNTETLTSASASGTGATSSSHTNTHSNSVIGNGINIQNTVSSSHSLSTSLTGTTSAGVGANSATQNNQFPNTGLTGPSDYNQYQPQPDITHQQNSQQPFVEMKVVGPGFQENPQPGIQQPDSQFGYQQPEFQRPNFQPEGIEQIVH